MAKLKALKQRFNIKVSTSLERITMGNQFFKNVLLVSGGTVFAHAIVLLLSPVITRLYPAEAFGLFQQYQSVLSFLVIAAALRYEMAILIPEDDKDSFALTVLSLLINLSIFIILLGICCIFYYFKIKLFFIKGLSTFMWFLPFAFLGAAIYQSLTYFIIRVKAFSKVGYTKIVQYSGLSAIQIYGGYHIPIPFGLFIGDIISKFLGLFTLLKVIVRDNKRLIKSLSWDTIWVNAKRYKNYPLISAPGSLINAAGSAIPMLLIGDFFGLKVLGYYALVDRIFSAPGILIGQSVSQVYMADVGVISQTDPGRLKNTFVKLVKKLGLISFFPLLIGAVFAPFLFQKVFGDSWREAGVFFSILAPMQFMAFMAWPLIPTLNLLEKQKWQLWWECFRLVLTCATLYCLNIYHVNPRIAISGYSAAMFIGYLSHLLLSYRAIKLCILQKSALKNGE